MSMKGYYEYAGRDEEGWPHYQSIKPVDLIGAKEQELILKECIIKYFEI